MKVSRIRVDIFFNLLGGIVELWYKRFGCNFIRGRWWKCRIIIYFIIVWNNDNENGYSDDDNDDDDRSKFYFF